MSAFGEVNAANLRRALGTLAKGIKDDDLIELVVTHKMTMDHYMEDLTAERDTATAREAEQRDRLAALPDDLRAAGWAVAVHNDYRQDNEPHTFWLLTKSGRAVKGEGKTDAEALNKIRTHLAAAREEENSA